MTTTPRSAIGPQRSPTVSALLALALAGLMAKAEYDANLAHDNPLFDLVGALPAGDKLGHFCLFGALSLLLDRALGRRAVELGRWRIPVAALLVIVLASAEELAQMGHPNRTLDLWDWLADLAGIMAFTWLGRRWQDRRQQDHRQQDRSGRPAASPSQRRSES